MSLARLTTDDVKELREALERVGAFERRSGWTWVRFFLLLGVSYALCLTALRGPWWVTVSLFPLSALTLTIAALYGHEGGHKSLSPRPLENELMYYLAFPFLGGLGAVHWNAKHNIGHHGHPNSMGDALTTDPDLDLWPMASSKIQFDASGPLRQAFQRRFQAFAFWPLTMLLVFAMRFESLLALRRHFKKRGADRAFRLDALALTGHYLCWIVLPGLYFGFGPTLAIYGGLWSFSGLFLAGIFVCAHFGLPIFGHVDDTWLLQMRATRNVKLSRLTAWSFVGLDHQIEHHLFPRMSHHKMRIASPIVKAWAERKGAPYEVLPLIPALVEATRFMGRAWDEVPVVDPPAVAPVVEVEAPAAELLSA
jgi:fatty acid desaturase